MMKVQTHAASLSRNLRVRPSPRRSARCFAHSIGADVHDHTSILKTVNRVAIIGGGVAGLQTARALNKIGKECVIFEQSSKVGGVWKENYDDYGLQVPKELYEFPEFPWPSSVKQGYYPTGPETQSYIESYAHHFGLHRHIRFNTSVDKIEPSTDGEQRWQVVVSAKGDEKPKVEGFDFVVVATGMYSAHPNIPKVAGKEKFTGDIYHSSTFTDGAVCAGKKVVVVGGGKSAIDNAVSGAKHGDSSVLLYRSAHWPVPRHLCDLVPLKWGTYSRFGHFMLHPHHDVSVVGSYMHGVMKPVKWIWWRVVELMFRVQFRIPREMVPSTPIETDVFSGGQILNYEFRDMMRTGGVKAVQGTLKEMNHNRVVLQDGTELEADVIVFGTGFAKNYSILDQSIQKKLDLERDGLYLYRNMLPPSVPGLAFVGSEVSTFNNILTHGLQSEWLSRVLDGKFELPASGEMEHEVEKMQAWKRSWMPRTSARASLLQLHMMKYHDALLNDMGESHRRKGWNALAECFAPYSARDYAPLFHGTKAVDGNCLGSVASAAMA